MRGCFHGDEFEYSRFIQMNPRVANDKHLPKIELKKLVALLLDHGVRP
jgi:hypothetical protein